MSKEEFTLLFDSVPTVSEVKVKINELKNLDISLMKIIFAGQVLNDDRLLDSYHVKDGNILTLFMGRGKQNEVKQVVAPVVEPVNDIVEEEEEEEVNNANDNYDLDSLDEQAINENQSQFAQMFVEIINGISGINGHGHAGASNGGQPIQINQGNINDLMAMLGHFQPQPMIQVELTDEQQAEVNEIVEMGMGTYNDVVQYYKAAECNKEMTINMLLDNRAQMDF